MPSKLMAGAEELKDLGNSYFRKNDFANSIRYYTLAIEENASNPIYYSNRSLAYIKKLDYVKAYNDACNGLNLLSINPDKILKSKLEYRRDLANTKLCQGDLITESGTEVNEDNDLKNKTSSEIIEHATTLIDGSTDEYVLSIETVEFVPQEFFIREDKKEALSTRNECLVKVHTKEKNFPERPTISLLNSFAKVPPEEISVCYQYIVSLSPNVLKPLFKVSGIDSDILGLYIDAAIWYLSIEAPEGDLSANIFNCIELFSKLPRFGLSSMFIDSKKKETLNFLLKQALGNHSSLN